MGEITLEQCVAREEEQAKKFYVALEAVRLETKTDIGLIRSAVQDIDRSVSRILGWSGLADSGAGAAAHPHHRGGEDEARLHERITDTVTAAMAASKTKDDEEKGLDWKKVLLVVALSLLAGVGILLLVQTKLDMDTIKQMQTLRGVVK